MKGRDAIMTVHPFTLKPGHENGWVARGADVIAPALIFLAPFVAFIRFQEYPSLSLEILAVGAVLAGLGLAVGVGIAMLPVNWKVTAYAVLMLVVFDWQMRLGADDADVRPFLNAVLQRDPAALWGIGKLWVGIFLIMMLFGAIRDRLGIILSVVFATILVSHYVVPGETKAFVTLTEKAVQKPAPGPLEADKRARDEGLPPVLHLILDEHIGVAGIPADAPGGARAARDLVTFYESQGFAVFGHAYSEYDRTYDSIANLLNAEKTTVSRKHIDGYKYTLKIIRNLWFERLADAGYRIRVYQSDFLDLCEFPAVEYCAIYPINNLMSLRDQALPVLSKARAVFGMFIKDTLSYKGATALHFFIKDNVSGTVLAGWVDGSMDELELSNISSMAVFKRLADDIRAYPRGTAFVAHVLLPHFSYVYDEDCELETDVGRWLSRSEGYLLNSEASRRERYGLYLAQVQCTTRQVESLLTALKSAGVYDEALVVVHGDHGSRISRVLHNRGPWEKLSKVDLIDIYSTLFVVKKPGLAPGYRDDQRSIRGLFARHVLGLADAQGQGNGQRPEAFLALRRDPGGKTLKPFPLPDFSRYSIFTGP